MIAYPNHKQLHIVRHGKSSWDYNDVMDIDRPLSERGIRDTIKMVKRYGSRYEPPELVLSSPANRALHTAMIYARGIDLSLSIIKIAKELYFADENEVIQLINNTKKDIGSIMLFGHNPNFTDFANSFLSKKIDNIPTAGIVSLVFNCEEWTDINAGKLHSYHFDYPKNSNK